MNATEALKHVAQNAFSTVRMWNSERSWHFVHEARLIRRVYRDCSPNQRRFLISECRKWTKLARECYRENQEKYPSERRVA